MSYVYDSERETTARAAGAAGLGTLVGLHRAVVARMRSLAERHWNLETRSGGKQAPIVFDGYLPPKENGVEQFPHIIVSPSVGQDDEMSGAPHATAQVDLFIGVYSDEPDGWLDALGVIDAIRLDVGGAPFFGGAFRHVGPLTWTLPDEQKRPQWMAHVSLQFELPRPRPVAAHEPPEV